MYVDLHQSHLEEDMARDMRGMCICMLVRICLQIYTYWGTCLMLRPKQFP